VVNTSDFAAADKSNFATLENQKNKLYKEKKKAFFQKTIIVLIYNSIYL
jgi:hypothetical protein